MGALYTSKNKSLLNYFTQYVRNMHFVCSNTKYTYMYSSSTIISTLKIKRLNNNKNITRYRIECVYLETIF